MNREKKKDLLKSFLIVAISFFVLFVINSIICCFKENEFNIFKKIFVYDAHWYKSIIDNGYMKYAIGDSNNNIYINGGQEGMANWAFFPLLPYIIKAIQILTFNTLSIYLISFLFSATCYIFFIYNVIQYLKEKNIKVNFKAIVLVFVINTIFTFMFTLYTESLFMLLLILFLRLCDKKKYLLSGLLCALLSALKVQGCFWCIYLFIKIYIELREKNKNFIITFFKTLLKIIKEPYYLFSIVISPLGLFAFLYILNYYGVSPLSFIHVQASWKKENNFFIITIFKSLKNINLTLTAIYALFFVFFTIYLFVKKKYLNSFMMLIYIIIACSSSTASIHRYMFSSVIFLIEIYIVFIELLENCKLKGYKSTISFIVLKISMIFKFLIFIVYIFGILLFNAYLLY